MILKRCAALPLRSTGPLLLLLGLSTFACATFLEPTEAGPACKNLFTPHETGVDPDPAPVLDVPRETYDEICIDDLAAHIGALTAPPTAGRRAGTEGERIAADYLSRVFASIGLEPAGDEGGMLHHFSFTSGIDLGPDNALKLTSDSGRVEALEVESDWRPLAFSRSGSVPASPIVFAGYGLLYPGDEKHDAIDDYAEIDVRDRWVLVFRDLPQSLSPARRQALQRHASLRYKAMVARDKGARGILFASGPLGRFRSDLIPLRFDASLAGTRIAVLSIADRVTAQLLADLGSSLEDVQTRLDAGFEKESNPHADPSRQGGDAEIERFELPAARLGGSIDLATQTSAGTNVLARLQVGDRPSPETIVLGAHFDHLGHGQGSSSLASGEEIGAVHPGADDNASGTAVLLEIAQALKAEQRAGRLRGKRDFVFAAWSGEELGLLGSNAWVEAQTNPHKATAAPVAYLNFDMVGRLQQKLVVQGLGSSPAWAGLLGEAASSSPLEISLQQDSYVPTDATSFYTQSVPVLNAFTGVHSEYHTPRDTADRLNLEGAAEIAALFTQIAKALSAAPTPPPYHAQEAPAGGLGRTGFRVFLGTVPDYAQTDVVGVRLSGVAPAGPAEQAGIRGGDIIVAVDERPIENLYDYTYALEALRVGVPCEISILREGERIRLEVVPGSRD